MRTERRSTLLLPLTLVAALSAWAAFPPPASSDPPGPDSRDVEDVVVMGRVTSAQSGGPVSGAQVFVEALQIGTLSQADGSYVLRIPRNRISGDVTLTVERIGYGTVTEVIGAQELTSDSLVRDFTLQEQALELQEVVVAGAAGGTQRRALGNAVTVLHGRADDVDRSGSAAGSPARPLTAERRGPIAPPPHYRGGGTDWNREQYDHIAENGFKNVLDHPLSTFSIDVDRASYSNVRRFLLREHVAPPVDAVQVEEMINYFSYDYELPEGDHPVAITTELGVAPWNRDHRLLRIGLASRPVVTEDLPPSNLVFLLDVSGSMQSPDKLPLVKQSLRLLVEQLRSEDRVAIVVYAGAAGLVLESTPGSRKDRILDAIDRLEAGGSTAGGAGLRLAYRVARENFMEEGNNRVILATDGDFNVGESSDGAMIRLIEERRGQGTFLTVLGFGTGNLQSAKMQSIAQHGNGNYAYIDGLSEARKVFVGEMGGTLLTVAQDVKIQVEFNPAHVRDYRLVGYENRMLAAEDFNDDRKDAGEMGAGHRVTALYEIVPAGDGPGGGRVDPLRYQDRPDRTDRAHGGELGFVRVRYKEPRGTESRLIERPVGVEVREPSDDFQFASAVAGFGMLLRDSEHKGSMTTRRVLALAEAGLGADLEGYRSEFIDLVRAYDRLPERRHRR